MWLKKQDKFVEKHGEAYHAVEPSIDISLHKRPFTLLHRVGLLTMFPKRNPLVHCEYYYQINIRNQSS